MEKKIRERVLKAIYEQVFPGCAIGIIRKNGKRLVLLFGGFTYEDNAPQIQENSIFDVASITKVIPTSSLALKLIDEGRLSIDDKLIEFVPQFHNSDRENILIKHLLTRTLDYDFKLSDYKDKSPNEILEVIFTSDFRTEPGKRFSYTNATSVLLGLVVEKIFNDNLDNLGEEYFFKPLQMYRTSFQPLQKFSKDEIVPTEIDDWRKRVIQGEVHDESAFALSSEMAVGAAGLFSTVSDLLNFLEMLLNNGTLNGFRYFSSETVKLMHTNQLGEIGAYHGLGWELYQPHYMGRGCTKETFGKTGFTGCVVISDIKKGAGIVILANATYPKRKPREIHRVLINQVRSDIADIVFTTS